MKKWKRIAAACLAAALAVPAIPPKAVEAAVTKESAVKAPVSDETYQKLGLPTSDPAGYKDKWIAPYGNKEGALNAAMELVEHRTASAKSLNDGDFQNADYQMEDQLYIWDKNQKAGIGENIGDQRYGDDMFGGSKITRTISVQKTAAEGIKGNRIFNLLQTAAVDYDGDGVDDYIVNYRITGGSPFSKDDKDKVKGYLELTDPYDENQTVKQSKEVSSDPLDFCSTPQAYNEFWEMYYNNKGNAACQANVGMMFPVAAGDFDGDGKDEIAVRINTESIRVYDLNDDGTINGYVSLSAVSSRAKGPMSLYAGDINQNGADELVVGHGNQVTIFETSVEERHDEPVYGELVGMEKRWSLELKPREVVLKDKYDFGVRRSTEAKWDNVSAVYGDIDGNGKDELVIAYEGYGKGFEEGMDYNLTTYELFWGKMELEYGNNVAAYSFIGDAYTDQNAWFNKSPFAESHSIEPRGFALNQPGGVTRPMTLAAARLKSEDGVRANADTLWIGNRPYRYNANEETFEGLEGTFVARRSLDEDEYYQAGSVNVMQVVAGNFDGNVEGNESFYYYWDGGISDKHGKTDRHYYAYECLDGTTLETRSTTVTRLYYAPSFRLTVGNFDNDSSIVSYQGRQLTFTDPKVLAVLASPPYFEEHNLLNDGFASNGSTTYGSSSGSSTTDSHSVSVSAGAYASFGYEFKEYISQITIAAFESEIAMTYEYNSTFSESKSHEYSVDYSSNGGEDSVAMIAIPEIVYDYKVRVPVNKKEAPEDDKDGDGYSDWQDLSVVVPMEPIKSVVPAETYQKVADRTEGLPTVYGDNGVLIHTVGIPSTYEYDKAFREKNWRGEEYLHNNVGDSSMTQTISNGSESEEEMETGFSMEAKVGAGSGGWKVGVTAGSGYSYGWAKVTSNEESISGQVMNMPKGAEKYSFDWQLGGFTRNYQTEYMEKPESFIVAAYDVRNVSAPPRTPVHVEVSNVTMTGCELSWEDAESPTGDYPSKYAVLMTSELFGEKETDVYGIYQREPGSPVQATVIENLQPGEKYSFQVVSMDLSMEDYSEGSIPTEAVTIQTRNSEATPVIITQPSDVMAAPGDNAVFDVEVEGAIGSDRKIYYRWLSRVEGGDWVSASNISTASRLTLSNVTEEMDGRQYRCQISQSVDGVNIVLTSDPAVLHVAKNPSVLEVTVNNDEELVTIENNKVNFPVNVAVETGSDQPAASGEVYVKISYQPNSTNSTNSTKKQEVFRKNLAGGKAVFDSITISEINPEFLETDLEIVVGYVGDERYAPAVSETYHLYPVLKAGGTAVRKYLTVDQIPESITYGDTAEWKARIVTINGSSITSAAEGVTVECGSGLSYDSEKGILRVSGLSEGQTESSIHVEASLGGKEEIKDYTVSLSKRSAAIAIGSLNSSVDEDMKDWSKVPVVFENLAEGESEAGLRAALSLKCEASLEKGIGVYPITLERINGDYNNNYNFIVTPGEYVIKAASRTIIFEQPYDGTLSAVYRTTADTSVKRLESGEDVPYQAEVTFTAVPDELYRVKGWTVNGETLLGENGPVTSDSITVTADTQGHDNQIKVAAELERYNSTLSWNVTNETGGAVTAAAVNSGKITDNPAVLSPSLSVVMTAEPEDGFQVKQWTVNGAPVTREAGRGFYQGLQLELGKMTGDKEVSVEFEPITENSKVAVNYEVVTENNMSYGSDFVAMYADGVRIEDNLAPVGSDVRLMVQGDSSYDILYWTVNGVKVSPKPNPITSYTIKSIAETADVKIYVSPTMGTRNVTFGLEGVTDQGFALTAVSGGKKLASGDPVPYGQPVKFTLEVPDHYENLYQLNGWKINGADPVDAESFIYTAESVKSNLTVQYSVSKYAFHKVEYRTEGTRDGDVIELTAFSGDEAVENGSTVREKRPLTLVASMSDAQKESYYVDGFKTGDDDTVIETGTSYQVDSVEAAVAVRFAVRPIEVHYVTVSVATTSNAANPGSFIVTRNGREIEPEADGRYAIYENAKWQVTARPESGWSVTGWEIGDEEAGISEQYEQDGITQDMDMVIFLSRVTNKITFKVSAEEGDIYAECQGVELVSGDQPRKGSVVTFTAIPSEAYQVADWLVNGVAQKHPEDTFELTVDGPAKVEAVWERSAYEITYEAEGNGELTADAEDGELVAKGTEVVLTAQADDGYEVSKWYVNGKKQPGNRPQLTVEMQEDTKVKVVFEKVKLVKVTIEEPEKNGSLRVYVSGTGEEVLDGTEIGRGLSLTVTAEAEPGFALGKWLGSAKQENPLYSTIELKNVTEDVTIGAEFVPARICDVKFDTGDNGTIRGEADGNIITLPGGRPIQIDSGTELEFTAEPEEGYMVDSWTVNGKKQDELGNTLTLNLITTIHVKVTFKKIVSHTITIDEGSSHVDTRLWPEDWSEEGTIRDQGSIYFEITEPQDGSFLRGVTLIVNGNKTVIPVEKLPVKDDVALFTRTEAVQKAAAPASPSNGDRTDLEEKEVRMIYRTAKIDEPVVYILTVENVRGDVELIVDCARKYLVGYEANAGGSVTILADGKKIDPDTLIYEDTRIEYRIEPGEGYRIVSVDGSGKLSEDKTKMVIEALSQDESISVVFEKIEKKPGGGSGGGSSSSGGVYAGRKALNTPGTWIRDAKGWWFKEPAGTWPAAAWKQLVWNGVTSWYYFNADGYLATGWLTDQSGNTYYLHPVSDGTQGYMYTGWHKIDGQWYYFSEKIGGPQGALLKNAITPDGYRVDEKGIWVN